MAHPPLPGRTVQPNLLPVMEAIADITFPISKRDLLEQVGDDTVLLHGTNVSLHDLVKDIHDDAFASDAEFLSALQDAYGNEDDEGSPPTPMNVRDERMVRTERAGPVEYGRAAMVRSDVDAQEE